VQNREPVFNVPGAVLATVAVLAMIHAGRVYLLAGDTNMWLLLALSFIPARYAGLASEIPGGELAAVTSFFTHMLVHADGIHLAINSVVTTFGSVLE
jgi:membrane associated rhomboid family serine protease